ncbi:MAG TPA: hypothetical protein VEF04_04780 [Blastocatellia bacterium]|nr:hypothetical protein [Blastocatellia bacterium]
MSFTDVKEKERALFWLIAAYRACHRQGWEEGMTEDELWHNVICFLANRDLDPNVPKDAANVKELLAKFPECKGAF